MALVWVALLLLVTVVRAQQVQVTITDEPLERASSAQHAVAQVELINLVSARIAWLWTSFGSISSTLT